MQEQSILEQNLVAIAVGGVRAVLHSVSGNILAAAAIAAVGSPLRQHLAKSAGIMPSGTLDQSFLGVSGAGGDVAQERAVLQLEPEAEVSQHGNAQEAHDDCSARGQGTGSAPHLPVLLRVVPRKALLGGCKTGRDGRVQAGSRGNASSYA